MKRIMMNIYNIRGCADIKIFIVLFLFVIFLSFHEGILFAQQAQKPQAGQQQKSSSAKIIIEYVSFPDIFRSYEVYPWETLKIEGFRRAYSDMIGSKIREEWLSSLTGTGNRNKMLHVFRTHFVLVASCRPHFCDESQILTLFDPVKGKCFAINAEDGKFYYLGNPDENIKNLLKILLVEEYRGIYKAQ